MLLRTLLLIGCGPAAPGNDPDAANWENAVERPDTADADTGSPSNTDSDSGQFDSAEFDSGVDSGDLPLGSIELDADDAHLIVTSWGTDGEFGYDIEANGDFDGDGQLDLVVVSWLDDTWGRDVGTAYVFFGPVVGDLSPGSADVVIVGDFAVGSVRGATAMDDIDGDGKDELAIRFNDTGRIYLSGVLVPGVVLRQIDGNPLGWDWLQSGIVWDDVTGDGVPELIVGDAAADEFDGRDYNCGMVEVLDGADLLRGVRTTLANTMTNYPSFSEVGNGLALPGDRDGDGIREIAAGDGYGWVVLHSSELLAHEYRVAQRVTGAFWAVPFGDADGDGWEDLAVSEGGSTLAIALASAGDVEVKDLSALQVSGASMRFEPVTLGDRDGDGLAELVISYGDESSAVLVPGAAVLAGGTLDTFGWSGGPADVTAMRGDLEGNVWFSRCDQEPWMCTVWKFDTGVDGVATEASAAATLVAEGPSLRADYLRPVWADVDADGLIDLALLGGGTYTGGAVVGAATVSAGGTVTACDGGCVASIGVSGMLDDLDGDGAFELIEIRDSAPECLRHPLSALIDGFDTATILQAEDCPTGQPSGPGQGDVTGDGLVDPMMGGAVYDGNSFFTDAWPPTLLASVSSYQYPVGDVNGDGMDDVATGWGIYSGAELRAGVGTSDLTALWVPESFSVTTLSNQPDIDGDGMEDVALSLESGCGWTSGVPPVLPTESDFVLGVSTVSQCKAAFMAEGWAIFGAAYGEVAEIRAWRTPAGPLLDPESYDLRIVGAGHYVVWAGVDPIDDDSIAILVNVYSADADGGSLRLFRFPP